MSGAIPPASWPATKRAICLEYPDSPEWTALLTGVLLNLSFGYYWDKNYSNWEDARNVGTEILQSWFAQIRCDAGAIPVLEPQCVDFPNNSPMLDWEPTNPFTQPGTIPPGYVAQPWGVVPDPPVFPYQPGDVISGLFGLPVLTPAINQGLARVRIKFNGRGTVEVHIIKVALGGISLITWDDNPFTARFVDTSMDFLAIPPESGDEDIQEISFETGGDHHIDVTMLPRFSAEVGFAGYGGGIRKVVLCGPDMQFIDKPGVELWREDGEDVAICEAIRYNNGVLEGYCCGEWSPIPGAPGAVPGAVTQPPPSAPPEVGACNTYYVTLNGRDKWILPFTLNSGDTVQVSSATGGWNDGGLTWACPTGAVYGLSICGAPLGPQPGDPVPTKPHMQLIGQVGTVDGYFDPFAGLYTVPGGTADAQLTFQANDDNLADNQGSVTFQVVVCHNVESTWHSVYDFSLGPLGWSAMTCSTDFPCDTPTNDGTVAGTWVSGQWHYAQPVGTGDVLLSIETVPFDPSFIRSVTVVTNDSGAISDADGKSGLIVSYDAGGAFHIGALGSVPGGVITSGILMNVPDVTAIIVSLNDYTGSQTANIMSIDIEGVGPKPPQLI